MGRSVVVEAAPDERFGFDTEGVHLAHGGTRTAAGRWQHRYLLAARSGGGTVAQLVCRYLLTERTDR